MDDLYIVEYYYDPHARLWRADVLDEEGNVVHFEWSPTEDGIKYEIDNTIRNQYAIIRSTKTSFYK